MKNTIKYLQEHNGLIIPPSRLTTFIKTLFEQKKRQYLLLEKQWTDEKLLNLIKRIDEHNKDVEQKKSVYSFNTYQPIDEVIKKIIIENEKNFFIYVESQFYDFDNCYKVVFRNNKEEEHNNPDFLNYLDWNDVKLVEIKINTRNNSSRNTTNIVKEIEIVINNSSVFASGFIYEIKGEDETWVKSMKSTIEEFIETHKKMPVFYKYRLLGSMILSLITSYVVFSLIYTLNINDWLYKICLHQTEIIIKIFIFIFFIFALFKWYIELSRSFPNLSITDNYSPKKSFYVSSFITIISSIILSIIGKIANNIPLFK